MKNKTILAEAQEEAQEIADEVTSFFDIRPIEVQVKRVQRGRARTATRKITIPLWAYKVDKQYGSRDVFFTYYVTHEVIHFLPNVFGHAYPFKKKEIEALEEIWWVIPIYKKVYPHTLISTVNDEVLWTEHVQDYPLGANFWDCE